ncbi:MAG: hypothetical protein FJY88_00700 [Candidatus Eisenbacteria bacterium]|nr:hypothetical protein [Candidatus Eisenbacteria bacterium]
MTYRLNFYRDYHLRRRLARRRTYWTAAVTVLIGIEVVIVGVLVLSSVLLGQQVDALRGEISRVSLRTQDLSVATPEAETARALLEIRRGRIDWSPKLTAVSSCIDRQLRLESLVGQVSEKGRPPRLVLGGVIRSGGDQAAPVSRFMEAMRRDPSIAADLPEVRLGAMDASDAGESRFQIVCETRGGGDGQ